MNFRGNAENNEEDSFQIAPFIDIVFLLLIFFLLTARLEAEERQINLELPSASQGKIKIRKPDVIVINIDQDGKVTIRDEEWKIEPPKGERGLAYLLSGMKTTAPGSSAIIRADGRTPHKFVVGVLNVCRKVNMQNVSIATLSKYRN